MQTIWYFLNDLLFKWKVTTFLISYVPYYVSWIYQKCCMGDSERVCSGIHGPKDSTYWTPVDDSTSWLNLILGSIRIYTSVCIFDIIFGSSCLSDYFWIYASWCPNISEETLQLFLYSRARKVSRLLSVNANTTHTCISDRNTHGNARTTVSYNFFLENNTIFASF